MNRTLFDVKKKERTEPSPSASYIWCEKLVKKKGKLEGCGVVD